MNCKSLYWSRLTYNKRIGYERQYTHLASSGCQLSELFISRDNFDLPPLYVRIPPELPIVSSS